MKNIPLEDRVDILARTLGDVERKVALLEHRAKMDALEEQVRALSNRIGRMERNVALARELRDMDLQRASAGFGQIATNEQSK
jgi:uncharacterized coiled-coil protein SlyX